MIVNILPLIFAMKKMVLSVVVVKKVMEEISG
jgi:hypothetical protein